MIKVLRSECWVAGSRSHRFLLIDINVYALTGHVLHLKRKLTVLIELEVCFEYKNTIVEMQNIVGEHS